MTTEGSYIPHLGLGTSEEISKEARGEREIPAGEHDVPALSR